VDRRRSPGLPQNLQTVQPNNPLFVLRQNLLSAQPIVPTISSAIRARRAFRNAPARRPAIVLCPPSSSGANMEASGYTVRETDPFEDRPGIVLAAREVSPYVNCLRLMWDAMREPVREAFPEAPGRPSGPDA
jgi:hypothetical protein